MTTEFISNKKIYDRVIQDMVVEAGGFFIGKARETDCLNVARASRLRERVSSYPKRAPSEWKPALHRFLNRLNPPFK